MNLNFLETYYISKINENNDKYFKIMDELENNLFIYKKNKKLLQEHIFKLIRTKFLEKKYLSKWIMYNILRKKSVNENDLELNIINEKNCIVHIDKKEKKKYLFSQKDIKKIIENNLFNSCNYYHKPSPLELKNPYTNKIFSKSELICINKQIINPPLIWSMFRESLYNIHFLNNNFGAYLQTNCIKNYVEKLYEDDIREYILDIFAYLNVKTYCKTCFAKCNFMKKEIRNIICNWIFFCKYNAPFNKDKQILELCKYPCFLHSIKKIPNNQVKNVKKDRVGLFIFTSNNKPLIQVKLNIQNNISVKLIINDKKYSKNKKYRNLDKVVTDLFFKSKIDI